MKLFLSYLRSVAAVLSGFLVIVLGTVLTLEVLLDGIGLHTSSPTELAVATLGALASGFAGGLVAARLAGRRPRLHAAGVLVPIALDTTSIVVSASGPDPLWFDLGGSATLVFGVVAAAYLVEARRHSHTTSLEPG